MLSTARLDESSRMTASYTSPAMTIDTRSRILESIPPLRRAIRRSELRKIVPLANTTIYEMECRGEFPKRFYLTPRCVVWDLDEVYAWLDARKQPAEQAKLGRVPAPDVRLRRRRPLKSSPGL